MRKQSVALIFAAIMLSSSTAMALGSFGIRIGTGTSFVDGLDDQTPEPTVTPFAAGLSYTLNLAVAEVEIDALYWSDTSETDLGPIGKFETTGSYFALPIIGRASLPIIPKLFSLSVGAGLEPRFLLSAESDIPDFNTDGFEDMVMYLPISVVGKVSVPMIATVGVEVRYEYQLTESVKGSDVRINQLVFMGGVDF